MKYSGALCEKNLKKRKKRIDELIASDEESDNEKSRKRTEKGNDDVNTSRRNAIKPSLNTDYRALISPQNPLTDNLLGENISEQLKTITEANKVEKTLHSHDDVSKS